MLFPYGAHDDQMDALSQFLQWIKENPNLSKRMPMATIQGVDSRGRILRSSGHASIRQINGVALQSGQRLALK
jgi:hypothetical protein